MTTRVFALSPGFLPLLTREEKLATTDFCWLHSPVTSPARGNTNLQIAGNAAVGPARWESAVRGSEAAALPVETPRGKGKLPPLTVTPYFHPRGVTERGAPSVSPSFARRRPPTGGAGDSN
eukprot:1182405-Prorocentrum_minimum.AAC.7